MTKHQRVIVVLWASVSLVLNQNHVCIQAAPPLLAAPKVDPRVACAFSLARSDLADSTLITVLGHAPWLDGFLEVADVPVTLLRLGDGAVPAHNLEYDVVFVVTDGTGNQTFVEDALKQVRRSHPRCSPRVVVWWRAGDAQEAVDAAWDMDMGRLIVVNESSNPMRVFGYRNECRDGSLVAKAHLVGDCTSRGLFLDIKHWNFMGCKLRIAALENPPALMLNPEYKGVHSMTGVVADLADTLAERFNAVLDLHPPSNGLSPGMVFPNGTVIGLLADIMHRRHDMALHEFSVTPTRNQLVDLSSGYRMSCVGLGVPSGLGPPYNPWMLLFLVFEPFVWMMVAATFCVTLLVLSAAWWRFSERPVNDSALYILSVLLSNTPPTAAPTSSVSVRIVLVHLLIFSIVIGTAFQAARQSKMAAPVEAPEINDLTQLRKSGLKIVSHPTFIDMLTGVAEEYGDNLLLKVMSQTVPALDIHEVVREMALHRNLALFFMPDTIVHYTAPLRRGSGPKLVHILPNYCPITDFPVPFMLRRGSPWTGAVSYLVSRAFECGIIDFWERRHEVHRPAASSAWSQLSLTKLRAVFQLLLLGAAISMVVLLVEVLMRTQHVNARMPGVRIVHPRMPYKGLILSHLVLAETRHFP